MDVITFGESMVLFHPSRRGPLRYVQEFEKKVGGAESNVAIALARLGHDVSWISRLGNDEFGLYIRNFIRGEGVDTSSVTFDDSRSTGLFFKETFHFGDPKVYYYRHDSAASGMGPADIKESDICKAKILHITGITPVLSQSCKELTEKAIEIAKRNKVRVVFDPNIRLKLCSKEYARKILMEIASKCDIVLPGIEEGIILTGEKTPEKISKCLIQNGTGAVVVKMGALGAFYQNGIEQGFVNGYKVDHVVDTVGAGDGFAAGFISGILRGWSYQDAVRLGNRIGAYAVTVPGDVEGYPYWSQIDPNQNEEILR
ncbi:MAG TPA: sugar kinase [Bacillales bacterium]|nr:sugar kinase [Bacillales bacterium]